MELSERAEKEESRLQAVRAVIERVLLVLKEEVESDDVKMTQRCDGPATGSPRRGFWFWSMFRHAPSKEDGCKRSLHARTKL